MYRALQRPGVSGFDAAFTHGGLFLWIFAMILGVTSWRWRIKKASAFRQSMSSDVSGHVVIGIVCAAAFGLVMIGPLR